MWNGLRTTALIMAMGTCFPAAAQNTDLSAYALFAADGLRARGLRVPAGDIGVNDGPLWVTDALNGPDATVVAELVRVGRRSECAGILATDVADPVSGCALIGPFASPLVPDVAEACGYPEAPPACDPSNDVTVGHGETRSLPPGVYGDLAIAGGGSGKGRVVFEGGDYVFCEISGGRRAQLAFEGPSTVFVEGDVRLANGSTTGPADGSGLSPDDVELFVGGNSVRFSRRSEVTAQLCAPDARLALSVGSRVTGSFVAKLIRADRITATNEGSTSPSSTTSSTGPSTTTTTSTTTTSTIAPSTTSTTTTSTTTSTEVSTTTTSTTVPACDPQLGQRAIVTVSYDATSVNLNSGLVNLTYPAGLSIPGSGQEPSVQARILPIALDVLTLGNDKDTDVNGVDETLTVGLVSLADEPTNPNDGIQPGEVFAVQFDCNGGPVPDDSAVGCFVEGAVDALSNPIPSVACSVVLGPGTPVTTTTTEPPTTTIVTTTTTIVTTTTIAPTTTTLATTTTTAPSTTVSTSTTAPSTTSTSSSTTTTAPPTTSTSSSTTTTSLPSTTSTSSSSTTTTSTSSTTSTTAGPAVCGNGVTEPPEECDDMNDENTDDCVAGCKDARCGDTFFHSGVEQCEDGNTVNGDGCSSTCMTEPPVCGNSRIESGETCDDGNTNNGDACPSNCRIESCTPSAVRLDTTVVFTKPAGVNVGSMVVFVNYPDGRANLPGVGNSSTVRARITNLPTGFVHTANDLDYAIREVISPSLPGNVLGGNTLFKASYDRCTGQTAPVAGDFTCTVEQVGSPSGTSISPTGFTCSVTIP